MYRESFESIIEPETLQTPATDLGVAEIAADQTDIDNTVQETMFVTPDYSRMGQYILNGRIHFPPAYMER